MLTYGGRLNLMAARFSELLFIHADRWIYVDCFDVYQKHFGIPLELNELKVEGVEELLYKPNLRSVMMVSYHTVIRQGFHVVSQCLGILV